MRCLTGSVWGADRVALRNIYIALVRSVLEYGCIVFGSAAGTSLKRLDKIQAQALRLCCGAVMTTPISALQVEVGEMPLTLRRKQLRVNYWANLQSQKDTHRTKKILNESWESKKIKKEVYLIYLVM